MRRQCRRERSRPRRRRRLHVRRRFPCVMLGERARGRNYLAGNRARVPAAYTGRAMRGRQRTAVGPLLKQWRERRKMSHVGLSGEAGLSARHLSFVETGRAQPSRELVLALSRALDVPLRGRNELLTAAGFAPIYRETTLDAPELARVRLAVDFILRQQEPYPA